MAQLSKLTAQMKRLVFCGAGMSLVRPLGSGAAE